MLTLADVYYVDNNAVEIRTSGACLPWQPTTKVQELDSNFQKNTCNPRSARFGQEHRSNAR